MKTFAYPHMQSWEAAWRKKNHNNIFVIMRHIILMNFLCSSHKKKTFLIIYFRTKLLLVVSNLPNMHLTSITSMGAFRKVGKHHFSQKGNCKTLCFLLSSGAVGWGMVLLQNHPLPWWARSPWATTAQPHDEQDRRLPLFVPLKHSSH